MLKEQFNELNLAVALPGQALAATANGTIIDKGRYEALTFVISAGAFTYDDTTNLWTITVQHGDAANLSDAATVATADLLGDTAGALLINTEITAAGAEYKLGYIGAKRYVRLVFTETGTCTGVLAATAVQGLPYSKPVA